MKVLRAAVVLGVSTPLIVLACGGDDGRTARRQGAAGEGGEGADAGTSGSQSAAGQAAGGNGASGGPAPGDGGVGGGSPDAGGAPLVGGGGAGDEPEAVCGDASLSGGLVCFAPSVPFEVGGEGQVTDVAIGAWDAEDGLDVIVAGPGLAYLSNQGAGVLAEPIHVGTSGVVLGSGQLDSGEELDLLLGQVNSGSSTIAFGDGAGSIATSTASAFNSEGVLYNYFVADVTGSGASQDVVVTFNNAIHLVLTTGTEGEGFQGSISSSSFANPVDAVLATLGTSQWLVYSADTNIYRQSLTYDVGSVTLGAALATPAGGSPGQLDVGDFNEDGVDDVAATLTGTGNVSVLFGGGVVTGDFADVTDSEQFLTLTVGGVGVATLQPDVKVGDFNGDDHADLALSVPSIDAVAIFSGDGAGNFSAPELLSTGDGSGPTRLAVGDLNGDAVDDLAVAGATSNRLIILLSTP